MVSAHAFNRAGTKKKGRTQMTSTPIGHNSGDVTITVETRLFNSLTKFANGEGPFRALDLPAGSTVGDLVRALALPLGEVFLVMRNGRDVTPSLNDGINADAVLDHGDVIALSGPVPYSWGYGAPIV